MASTTGKESTRLELSFPRLEAIFMMNKIIYLLIGPNSWYKLEEASPSLSTNERSGFLAPQPIFESRLQV
jgi:hypothetical protein